MTPNFKSPAAFLALRGRAGLSPQPHTDARVTLCTAPGVLMVTAHGQDAVPDVPIHLCQHKLQALHPSLPMWKRGRG